MKGTQQSRVSGFSDTICDVQHWIDVSRQKEVRRGWEKAVRGRWTKTRLLRLRESKDEVTEMKGVGRETSFHPRLICPVAAEPEDGDALMSKSVCV